MKFDLKGIINFPGKFGKIISYFFIVLSILLFIYFIASLVSQLSSLITNFDTSKNYSLEIIKLSEILLASLLFTVIPFGIVKIIYRQRVEEIENELRKQTGSSEGVLPFQNLVSIEDLEKYIFSILIFQILLILLESLSQEKDNFILISKGISASFIIIALSIYLYLTKK